MDLTIIVPSIEEIEFKLTSNLIPSLEDGKEMPPPPDGSL
jgi:hypothetical protein